MLQEMEYYALSLLTRDPRSGRRWHLQILLGGSWCWCDADAVAEGLADRRRDEVAEELVGRLG
jgi:hypothetical protein